MQFALLNNRLIMANSRLHKNADYRCPFCHHRVVLRGSFHRRTYFAHYHYSKNCGGQTYEHRLGKLQLARFFRDAHFKVRIEKDLPSINQRPDLMVNWSVVEFQCSPISAKRLKSRNNGYHSLNLPVIWVLGSPYQKRQLGSSYVSRFVNYSIHLGFFLLFWRVESNCLEVRYSLREISGYLRYRIRLVRSYSELKKFVRSVKLIRPSLNYVHKIKAEIQLNQHRLFHGNRELVDLQCRLNSRYHSPLCCPLICHVPLIMPPLFKKEALLWRIWIIILLKPSVNVKKVYQAANRQLKLPLNFCQIRNLNSIYWLEFNNFLKLLIRNNFLVVKNQIVVKWRSPKWFINIKDKLNSFS